MNASLHSDGLLGLPHDRHSATVPVDPVTEPHVAIEMTANYVQLAPDGSSQVLRVRRGPHPNLPGFVVGAPTLTRDAPHGGELHPDGDELLLILSGRVQVILSEGEDDEESVEVRGGQSFIVPRGMWHRVRVLEPASIVHITPGPKSRHRRSVQATHRMERHRQ